MTEHELRALERAIGLKVALLDRVRAMPESAWPRHVRSFLLDLAATGLQDERARFVLLATVIEELRLAADHARGTAGTHAWTGRFLQAGAEPGDLLGRSEQLLRRLRRVLAGLEQPDAEQPRSTGTAQVARLIDQRYMDRLTLTSLAASVREPRGRMVTAFRQEMGTTIHAYLTRVRVERAAHRLSLGEKVEAVMLAVGYHSKRSFYRQFRSLIGLTPGAYRDAAQAATPKANVR